MHDAVVCLAKFGETVSIEARPDKVGNIGPRSKSHVNDSAHEFDFLAQSFSVEFFQVRICFFLPRRF